MPTIAQKSTLSMVFAYRDDDGANSTFSLNAWLPVLGDFTSTSILKAVEETEKLIRPLTDGALMTVGAQLNHYDSDYPEPVAGGDVENKGVFLWTLEGNEKADFAVPAIKEEKLVSSGALAGIQIDLTDVDVAAFVDAMLNGIDLNPFGIGGILTFGSGREEQFTQLRDAYKQNRKSHKSRGGRG